MILGTDPGLTGALVLLAKDGERIIRCWDMPTAVTGKTRSVNAPLLADLIREAIELSDQQGERLQAVVERVASRPGQGIASSFNFGMGFGTLLGALGALDVRISLVTPPQWKKRAGLTGKEKDAGRTAALALWPESSELFQRVKDQGRADAALIGFHGRPTD